MICFFKKAFFLLFRYFFQSCPYSKIWFFSIFLIFQFLFKKWPQRDLANVVRNKVMKNGLIWSIHRSSTRDHIHGWAQCAPLCRIGLKATFETKKLHGLFLIFFLRKLVWFWIFWVQVPAIDIWGINPTQFSSLNTNLLSKLKK